MDFSGTAALLIFIHDTGAIPRLFTAWIRGVILWFSNDFAGKQRIGYAPDIVECPKGDGSSVSVRPRWKQGAPCGNQTTSIGLSLPIQVTPSPVTVTLTEAPVEKTT
jgi:hypothetical protein